MEYCHCGQPLHYTDPEVERNVRRLIAELGEMLVVEVAGRRWKVSRHYVALHGLKASEIARLGFEEVP